MSLWKKVTLPAVHVDKEGRFGMYCPVCGKEMTGVMEKLTFGIALNPDQVHVMTYHATCPECRSKTEGKLRFPDLCVRVGDEE